MVDWDAIEIELLPYGYPFPDAKTQLEQCVSSPDVEILTISRFYLNQMIGDLSYDQQADQRQDPAGPDRALRSPRNRRTLRRR